MQKYRNAVDCLKKWFSTFLPPTKETKIQFDGSYFVPYIKFWLPPVEKHLSKRAILNLGNAYTYVEVRGFLTLNLMDWIGQLPYKILSDFA